MAGEAFSRSFDKNKTEGDPVRHPRFAPGGWAKRLCCFVFVPILPVELLLFFFFPAEIFGGLAGGVFQLPYGFTRLAFGLFSEPFRLGFFIASPLACLPFSTAGNVFHLALDAVLIHKTQFSLMEIE